MRFVISAMAWVLISGCSSYSAIRAADNLKQGEIEVTGGATGSVDPYGFGAGAVVPVAHASIGVTDDFETGAHYETHSFLGEVRYGVTQSEDEGVAIAVGLTGGKAFERYYNISGGMGSSGGIVIGPTLTVGRRWNAWEAYAGGKVLCPATDSAYGVVSGRLGGRMRPISSMRALLVGIEGGGSWRFTGDRFGSLEGAAYVGVTL